MAELFPPFFLCTMKEKFKQIPRKDVRGNYWTWRVYGGAMLAPSILQTKLKQPKDADDGYCCSPVSFPENEKMFRRDTGMGSHESYEFSFNNLIQSSRHYRDQAAAAKVDYVFRSNDARKSNTVERGEGQNFIITPSMVHIRDPLFYDLDGDNYKCINFESDTPTAYIVAGDGTNMRHLVYDFVSWLYMTLGVMPRERQLPLYCDGMLGWANIFSREYLCGSERYDVGGFAR